MGLLEVLQMFNNSFFGYSKKDVDQLIEQIDHDYRTEEEKLKDQIRILEERCDQLKNENDENRLKVNKARNNYRVFMKTINNLLTKNIK
jgi:cell division septum initiation protein DivIVA